MGQNEREFERKTQTIRTSKDAMEWRLSQRRVYISGLDLRDSKNGYCCDLLQMAGAAVLEKALGAHARQAPANESSVARFFSGVWINSRHLAHVHVAQFKLGLEMSVP